MDQIKKIRKKIDNIDERISKLLKKRAEKVIAIGVIKKEEKLDIKDEEREAKIITKLDTDFEKEIFKKIIEESRKIQ